MVGGCGAGGGVQIVLWCAGICGRLVLYLFLGLRSQYQRGHFLPVDMSVDVVDIVGRD